MADQTQDEIKQANIEETQRMIHNVGWVIDESRRVEQESQNYMKAKYGEKPIQTASQEDRFSGINRVEIIEGKIEEVLQKANAGNLRIAFMPEALYAKYKLHKFGEELKKNCVTTQSLFVAGKSKAGNPVVAYVHEPHYFSDLKNLKKKNYGCYEDLSENEFYTILEREGNGNIFVVDLEYDNKRTLEPHLVGMLGSENFLENVGEEDRNYLMSMLHCGWHFLNSEKKLVTANIELSKSFYMERMFCSTPICSDWQYRFACINNYRNIQSGSNETKPNNVLENMHINSLEGAVSSITSTNGNAIVNSRGQLTPMDLDID